jgi:hypothetical protein
MTNMPMSDAPAAPPAPAKRKFPVWIIAVVGLVLVCVCVVCVVVGSSVAGPTQAAFQLGSTCQERTGLDANTCADWLQKVSSSGDISTCVSEMMSSQKSVDANSLYDCLDAKGAGPQQ